MSLSDAFTKDELWETFIELREKHSNSEVLDALPILLVGMALREAIEEAGDQIADAIRQSESRE
jgi:hypothetical protein